MNKKVTLLSICIFVLDSYIREQFHYTKQIPHTQNTYGDNSN